MQARKSGGLVAWHDGNAAEQRIAQDYERRGFSVASRRWRGRGGEIDLIARGAGGIVFVEVKKARDFARAAERLSQCQMQRIYTSAQEFLAGEPDGLMTNARFDVALVNASGQFEIIENAFGQF